MKDHKNPQLTNMPKASDESKVGSYSALCFAGAGFVWDEVLEYRVWSNEGGGTGFRAFADYDSAVTFSSDHDRREPVLALVRQVEHFVGDTPDDAVLVQEERICEWRPEWLRTDNHRPAMLLAALQHRLLPHPTPEQR